MKLDLLTNATVVDDAIKFVTEKGKEKIENTITNNQVFWETCKAIWQYTLSSVMIYAIEITIAHYKGPLHLLHKSPFVWRESRR